MYLIIERCVSMDSNQNLCNDKNDMLPSIVCLETYAEDPPKLPEEIIRGVLRCGHKMLISGASKAGKSYLLMELAISIANGITWLGLPCRLGRVLYINLEIDKDSCINRFSDIAKAMSTTSNTIIQTDNIDIWNLRGYALPLDQLVPILVNRIKDIHYDAIIVDPIYKVITGDENNASEMGRFCNEFDRICTSTGAAVIYCHHHSKGAQGSKRAADRASGSGVFARDPDAQLDLIQLDLPGKILEKINNINITAWRIEGSLREFPPLTPINIWYEWPLHYIDNNGDLDNVPAIGSMMSNLAKSSKRKDPEAQRKLLDDKYAQCAKKSYPVLLKDLAKEMDVSPKTVQRYLKDNTNYWYKSGLIGRCNG